MNNLFGRVFNRFTFEFLFRTRYYRFQKSLRSIDTQKPIRCVFFALLDSVWKCDSLYKAMLDDGRFEPIILICPIVNSGRVNMVKRMNDCASFFKGKGYNFIKAYDDKNGSYIDVLKNLTPDIIFYTNPYEGLIDSRYYIDQFPNTLCCYIPYFYASANEDMFFDMCFHHLLWRFYIENDQLKIEYQNKTNKKFRNINPVGYCVFDDYEVIKLNNVVKTIIWAPHHVISDDSIYTRNSFLKYHDLFFKLASQYKGMVKFVFRPHPLLKNKLYDHPEWGFDKTNTYYQRWTTTENCELSEDGDYIDLFERSDAMIHDCGSFLTEYIYYDKPGLYTVEEIFTEEKYWKCAIDAKQCYYIGKNINDIENFINRVVLGGDDKKNQERGFFINKYFLPYNNVAKNIINDLWESINNCKVFVD